MINTTEQCRCGHEKRKNLQWCSACWDSLKTKTQERYIAAAEALKAAVMSGNLDLDSGSVKNEQPDL